MKNTIVYIDGYNLYYGLRRFASGENPIKCKWLDIHKLCSLLLPSHNIIRIKYFTSRTSDTPDDPHQADRQNLYLSALKADNTIEIYYGKFLPRYRVGYEVIEVSDHQAKISGPTRIKTWEEKGSDVNLALHVLKDAYDHECNFPVIITNDSDQVNTLRLVRSSPLSLPAGVINPQPWHGSGSELRSLSTFYKELRKNVLLRSQFPDKINTDIGWIHRPEGW
ncbi:MAG: NYN domain-containing protein [Bacteroidales bacterium]|nr:NYN domain-containing protein [Bacteroidales bacterium]